MATALLTTLGRCLPAVLWLLAGRSGRSVPAIDDFQAFMAADC